jgi:hypothetical protein
MGEESMTFGTASLGEIFGLLAFSIPKVLWAAIKRMARRCR